MAAYAAVWRVAIRHALHARAEIIGRTCFYVLLLFIFSRLWQTALGDVALIGANGRPLTGVDLLWYMAATEWALIAVPHVQVEIERDVRSGDLAYQLARPISYVGVRLAEAAGQLAVRLLALGGAGIVAARLFSGGWPSDPAGLWLAIPCGVGAGLLALVFQSTIGVCAFWVQDTAPLYWVWQKLAFVLGGLLLPLELYPDWLRTIAEWTPFTALLYRTGRVAIGGWDPAGAAIALAWIGGWLLVATLGLAWVTARGRRIMDVNGG